MAYSLMLLVHKDSSSLALLEDGREKVKKEWKEERDMGRQLLEALRSVLEETGIQPEEVGEFRVEGEAPENFTSRRIAETVARVYNWAITQQGSD